MPTISITEPLTQLERNKVDKGGNEEISMCYLIVKGKYFAVTKATFEIWRERNPELSLV